MAGTQSETSGRQAAPGIVTASEDLARHIVQQCLDVNISEFVVCAGSRNSPLVLEILNRQLAHWSFFEERSAGFFALGRARILSGESAFVAVVTTSGTAAVELFPAVVEAHYLGVPLVLVTADRPRSFRSSGAPQAIEQVNLFGAYVDHCWDIEDTTFQFPNSISGSVHLNVCFDEPLLSSTGMEPGHPAASPRDEVHSTSPVQVTETVVLTPPVLVLLGALDPAQRSGVRDLLAQWGAPIWADATSGLREAPDLRPWMLQSGERILQTVQPRTVLRIGGVPSLRFWRDLESHPEIEVVHLLHGRFSGLARPSRCLASHEWVSVTGKAETNLLERDRDSAQRLGQLFEGFPQSEPALFRQLSQVIPEDATLFLGNSLPIREWNLAATYESRSFQPWANRGANGIDGNLSTFFGIAAHSASAWGVFGDLTTLYDLAAPWILRDLQPGKRIVVVNNGGGRIFSRLPVLGAASREQKRVTENTHDLSFQAWAQMWDLTYYSYHGGSVSISNDENAVVEIQPDADQTAAFWEALPGIYSG